MYGQNIEKVIERIARMITSNSSEKKVKKIKIDDLRDRGMDTSTYRLSSLLYT